MDTLNTCTKVKKNDNHCGTDEVINIIALVKRLNLQIIMKYDSSTLAI